MKRNPTAICVHGAGGGAWEWAIWQRVFSARGWNILAFDLMPVAGIAGTHIEDYLAQVQDSCARAPAPKVLIGASLGGLLALRASAPARAGALVLINPLPPGGRGHEVAQVEYPEIVPWARRRSLAGTLRAMPDADDAATVFAFRRWRDESGAVLRAAAAGIQVEIPACPILVLASERDTDVPPARSRQVAEQLGAEFRLLPGAGHVGPLLGRCANHVAEAAAVWCGNVMAGEST